MAGGGGGGAAPKHDDFTPHPVKDQLPGVSYCITSPPPWRESPVPSLPPPPRLRPTYLPPLLNSIQVSRVPKLPPRAGSRPSLLGNSSELRGAARDFERGFVWSRPVLVGSWPRKRCVLCYQRRSSPRRCQGSVVVVRCGHRTHLDARLAWVGEICLRFPVSVPYNSKKAVQPFRSACRLSSLFNRILVILRKL